MSYQCHTRAQVMTIERTKILNTNCKQYFNKPNITPLITPITPIILTDRPDNV